MEDIDFSSITLCDGHPVRMRRLRGGKVVVEGWNGAAWTRGPDAVDWADGRPATRKELRALRVPATARSRQATSSASGRRFSHDRRVDDRSVERHFRP
jgi:hypothetical protein